MWHAHIDTPGRRARIAEGFRNIGYLRDPALLAIKDQATAKNCFVVSARTP